MMRKLQQRIFGILCLILMAIAVGGCATVGPQGPDHAMFLSHQPRSILVLPPLNHSSRIEAGAAVLTHTIEPISELGYYVFPPALVDLYFKENGYAVAGEIHTIDPGKFLDIFGADAVLYLTVHDYGSKYQVVSSDVVVSVSGELLDIRSGEILWTGQVRHIEAGSSGMLEALIEQVINQLTDRSYNVARTAVHVLLMDRYRGFPPGHRHPEYGSP